MAGLLLCPLGHSVSVALTDAQILDVAISAHFPKRRFTRVEVCENRFSGEPLFLLARGAVVLSNGVLDEVLDALEIVFSHWRGSRSR